MNTHTTHTQVGGWRLWPMIVPMQQQQQQQKHLHLSMWLWCVGVVFGIGACVVRVFSS